MSKEGDKPNHIMLWSPQDWQGSALRMELILERDHLTRLVYFEILGKLHEEGGYLPRAAVSGVCGIRPAEAERAVERLLKSPTNLQVTDDGMLFNPRIINDLGARAIKRENYSTGAKKGWQARRSSNPMESHEIPSNPNGIGSDWDGEGEGNGMEKEQKEQKPSKPSKVTKGRQAALALDDPLLRHAYVYLSAFKMRKHPELDGDEGQGQASEGTARQVASYMGKLLALFPFEIPFLVSLPALVPNRSLEFTMHDATVLLRTGEHLKKSGSGGRCWAQTVDTGLSDRENALTARQLEILKRIGTLEWIKEHRRPYTHDGRWPT